MLFPSCQKGITRLQTEKLPIRTLPPRSRAFRTAWLRWAGPALALAFFWLAAPSNCRGQNPDRNPRGARTPSAQGRQARQGGPRGGMNGPGKESFLRHLSSLPADQQEKLL